MLQAVLEGVAFAIRDSFEVAKSLGVSIPRSNICIEGGEGQVRLHRVRHADQLPAGGLDAGEPARSHHRDTNARGCFIGMTMDTTRADMLQAVLEGVAFAIQRTS